MEQLSTGAIYYTKPNNKYSKPITTSQHAISTFRLTKKNIWPHNETKFSTPTTVFSRDHNAIAYIAITITMGPAQNLKIGQWIENNSLLNHFIIIYSAFDRCFTLTLRKHAYSNILKILQPKLENFQITSEQHQIALHTSAQWFVAE